MAGKVTHTGFNRDAGGRDGSGRVGSGRDGGEAVRCGARVTSSCAELRHEAGAATSPCLDSLHACTPRLSHPPIIQTKQRKVVVPAGAVDTIRGEISMLGAPCHSAAVRMSVRSLLYRRS